MFSVDLFVYLVSKEYGLLTSFWKKIIIMKEAKWKLDVKYSGPCAK